MNDLKELQDKLKEVKSKYSFINDLIEIELDYSFEYDRFIYNIYTIENNINQNYRSERMSLSLEQFNAFREFFKAQEFKENFNEIINPK